MRFGKIFTRCTLALHEIGNRIKPEAINTEIQPKFHHVPERVANLWIVEIQIWLMTEKSVPVVSLRNGVPSPIGCLCVAKNDAHSLITSVRITPDVPVPFRVFTRASS